MHARVHRESAALFPGSALPWCAPVLTETNRPLDSSDHNAGAIRGQVLIIGKPARHGSS